MQGLKDVRLKKYDYRSNGFYFVTLVTRFRQNKFAGKQDMLKTQLDCLTVQMPELSIDYWISMPDHIHIIFVLNNSRLTLGEIVRRFKAKVSYAFRERVWQPNYYEHIIRDEKALSKIREYIQNNPQAEILKFEDFYK